jgi:hypothetical protein
MIASFMVTVIKGVDYGIGEWREKREDWKKMCSL